MQDEPIVAKIELIDGELGFTLPDKLIRDLGLQEGDHLEHEWKDGVLILRKASSDPPPEAGTG